METNSMESYAVAFAVSPGYACCAEARSEVRADWVASPLAVASLVDWDFDEED